MGAILLKPPKPSLLARPVGGAHLKTTGFYVPYGSHKPVFATAPHHPRTCTMWGGRLLLLDAAPPLLHSPSCCFAVIVVAPSKALHLLSPHHLAGPLFTGMKNHSSRSIFSYPLSSTPVPLGAWKDFIGPSTPPGRHQLSTLVTPFGQSIGPGTTRKSDYRNTTALQCPCGSPSWHEGKHSYSRHSPSVQPLNCTCPYSDRLRASPRQLHTFPV